jgi:Flp pilus assembly secretin CpaC
MIPARALSVVTVTMFGLLMPLVFSGRAFAQATPVPPEAQAITVLLGQATAELFDSPIIVTAADTEIIEVSAALATIGNQKLYSVKGKKLGKTTLVVAGAQPKVYNVLVVRDPSKLADLQTFIASSYPGSNVLLKPSPDTSALIVDGSVADAGTAEQIIRLIEDSGYSKREIINRLSYWCAPSGCCWTYERHRYRCGY